MLLLPPACPAAPHLAVLPGLWPSYTLQAGASIDTSDTVDKVNRLQITAQGPTSVSRGFAGLRSHAVGTCRALPRLLAGWPEAAQASELAP